jgi:hypothetical protein
MLNCQLVKKAWYVLMLQPPSLLMQAYNYDVPPLSDASAKAPKQTPTPQPSVSPPAAKPKAPQPTPKPLPPENNNYFPKLERVVIPGFSRQDDLELYEGRLKYFNTWLNQNPGKPFPQENIRLYSDSYNALAKDASQATVDAIRKNLFSPQQARTTSQRISAYSAEWAKLVERNNRRLAQGRR